MPDLSGLLNTLTSGVLLGGLIALSAVGLSLVLGVMKLVNLAHGQFVVLGAFLAFYLGQLFGISPLLSFPVVFLLAALLGAPLQRWVLEPVSRHSEEAALLTAFAIGIILENVFVRLFSGDTRSLDAGLSGASIVIGPLSIPSVYLLGFLVSLVLCVGAHLLVTRTGFGRSLRASSEDPVSAAVVGIHVTRVRWLTFALNAGLASVGGVLIALCFSFTPSSGNEYLLTAFAVVVLGGLGNVIGTFLGGVVLGIVQALGAYVAGDGYRVFIGLLVLIVLLAVSPNGLLRRGRMA